MFEIDDAGNYIDKFGDIAVYSDGHGGVAIEQTILAQILENKNRIRGWRLTTARILRHWQKSTV